MARWTRLVLRFRWPILAFWLVVLLAGGFAYSKLTPLLSNTFTVPGTDSERARTILQDHFGDRSDGEFLIIYKIRNGTAGVRLKLERSIRRAATAVPTGKATALRDAQAGVVYGSILTTLNLVLSAVMLGVWLRPRLRGTREHVGALFEASATAQQLVDTITGG